MRRFPLRTLLLMVLALVVFGRLYLATHSKAPKEAEEPTPRRPAMEVQVAPSTGEKSSTAGTGAPAACGGLERALEAVVRAPEDASALAEAQRVTAGCPTPPARACELGAALDVRAPLAAGETPARGLLKALCQGCPAEMNPCVSSVTRTLVEASTGHARAPAEALWNLENAGPGTPAACAALVRMTWVPAATTGGKFDEALWPLMNALTPQCAGAGHVSVAVLNAGVVQQGARAQELQGLATAPGWGYAPVVPDQITGAEAGKHAFDGKEKSGVDLGNGQTPRWEADGALRGQFEPPLKQLTSLRVRAKGAGTLRAIVRMPPGLGLDDKERGTFFVNPTVCRFKGTGQWETCELPVPLVDVEAISVFPALPRIAFHELEVRGTR
ncbi:hypothetical protein [Hyalangium versicolor]|uniref:hypothetical protein n=1 Tax=Hyalangium versicolor TaxID=2861190 RepID=UPI001CD00AA3|nr:hypothetical protein [Hyalangium versicolor]